MKALIDKTINLLKFKVQMNLDVIKKNQVRIKEILQEPVSNERTLKLQEESEVNKKLLAENHDFINLQMTLIKFMEKHRQSLSFEEVEVPVDNEGNMQVDYYKMTLEGKLAYNFQHPRFGDRDFFYRLMNHYQSIEDYESCAQIMKYKPKDE
ncbi:MAG: hypothetical protein JXB49_20620 [Bacteroidales bacterium]|nr:hypothetical protein [Bacteroidales bacterium]